MTQFVRVVILSLYESYIPELFTTLVMITVNVYIIMFTENLDISLIKNNESVFIINN